MTSSREPALWYQKIATVAPQHVMLKAFGTMIFIAIFFGGYFYLLKFPAFAITFMPFTALDRWVAFQPWALPVYMSLWVYVSLPPVLMGTRHELYGYAVAMTVTCMAGLVIFFFWPTAVPPADIDWTKFPGVEFLKNMDASGNACPSLHVATAVFSGFWLNHLLRRVQVPAWLLLINWLWCWGIVYSTLATRQHVIVDVLGGLALGGLVAIASLRHPYFSTATDKICEPVRG